jgi:hypothetical protein
LNKRKLACLSPPPLSMLFARAPNFQPTDQIDKRSGVTTPVFFNPQPQNRPNQAKLVPCPRLHSSKRARIGNSLAATAKLPSGRHSQPSAQPQNQMDTRRGKTIPAFFQPPTTHPLPPIVRPRPPKRGGGGGGGRKRQSESNNHLYVPPRRQSTSLPPRL